MLVGHLIPIIHNACFFFKLPSGHFGHFEKLSMGFQNSQTQFNHTGFVTLIIAERWTDALQG